MRYGVLGPVEARLDDVPVAVGGPQQRRLLALLLSRPGESISSERLVDCLWPDGLAPDGAARSVMTYVSRLRTALGDASISTVQEGYLLELGDSVVDSQQFETLLSEAGTAEPGRATRDLRPGARALAGHCVRRVRCRVVAARRGQPAQRDACRRDGGAGGGAARCRPPPSGHPRTRTARRGSSVARAAGVAVDAGVVRNGASRRRASRVSVVPHEARRRNGARSVRRAGCVGAIDGVGAADPESECARQVAARLHGPRCTRRRSIGPCVRGDATGHQSRGGDQGDPPGPRQ